MTTHYKDLTQEVKTNLAALHKTVPQVMKGFGELGKAAMAEGALAAAAFNEFSEETSATGDR